MPHSLTKERRQETKYSSTTFQLKNWKAIRSVGDSQQSTLAYCFFVIHCTYPIDRSKNGGANPRYIDDSRVSILFGDLSGSTTDVPAILNSSGN
jgi:hypothetical protein